MAQVLTHNQMHKTPQEALLHYGVKGMKWGVRKEDGGAGSAPTRKEVKRADKVVLLEARAAKASVALKESKDRLASTPPGIKTAYKRSALKQEIQQNQAYLDHLNKNAQAVRDGKMTSTQKKLLVGGILAGGAVLAVYGSTLMESGELNAMKLRGKAALQRKPFDFERNEAFKNAKTPDEVLRLTKDLNPNYKTPGGQMNCRRCTFTYELRRRGYNVDATTSSMGYGQSESGLLNALSPGRRNVNRSTSLSFQVASGAGIRGQASGDVRRNIGDRFSHKDAKDQAGFFSLLGKQPSGARGEAVFNFGGFGHSLAYERFGDKTYIFDTQKGLRYDVGNKKEYDAFLTKWGYDNVKDVQVTRLDNLDLDKKFLARWATNREAR